MCVGEGVCVCVLWGECVARTRVSSVHPTARAGASTLVRTADLPTQHPSITVAGAAHRAAPSGVWNIMRSASPCLRTQGMMLTTLMSSARLPIFCGSGRAARQGREEGVRWLASASASSRTK